MSIQSNAFSVLNKFNPNVIVNLAAYTNVDDCEKHPEIAYAVNTFIVKNIVSWIKKTSDKCILVQLSTDHVYDNNGPHEENDVTIVNHYASSKFAGELFASSVNSVILRTNFFGISDKNGKHSFSDWIISSLNNGEHIQVFNNVLFNPLLINRLLTVIKMVIEKRIFGLYNVGSNNGMSKSDFSIAIANEFKMPVEYLKPCDINESNLFAKRPYDMRMNCSKFESVYNYRFPSLLEEIELLKTKYE
jgi:dTDP-4-dehydrorhamnose reductase